MIGRGAGDAIAGWKALADRIPVGTAAESVQPETFPLETDRGERWISISGVDFFGGIVYAFRDVTDARRLEELKADFVATASHELRTPLAAVYGAAQTLRRHDFALDEAGRNRFVSLIVDESERLNRIVNEILLANQLDAGRLDLVEEPFDAGDLIHRVVESAREHGPPRIRFETIVADGTAARRGRPRPRAPGPRQPRRERDQVLAGRRPHQGGRPAGRRHRRASTCATRASASRSTSRRGSSRSSTASTPR